MASRKGGVYDLLDFKYSEDPRAQSPGTREEEMRDMANDIVAGEYEDDGVEVAWRAPDFQRRVREEVANLRKTFPLEEHWYKFHYDPEGRPATSWQIHTAKLPDGSWEGEAVRFTDDRPAPKRKRPKVMGRDPETGAAIIEIDEDDIVQLIALAEGVGGPTFHERFHEKLATNERALLGALVRLAEGWSRRSNPRANPRKATKRERRKLLNRLLRI